VAHGPRKKTLDFGVDTDHVTLRFRARVGRYVGSRYTPQRDHCNQADVIPILEWTQVSVALGGFCIFLLDSEMGLLDFPGLESCWSW